MTKRKCKRKNKKAFTLIELLVVIAIIGILSVLVVAAVGTARERAHVAQMKNTVREINNMVQMYIEKNGNAPDNLSWGQDWSDSDQSYGKIPEQSQPNYHVTYSYSNEDGDTTYYIQGVHTVANTTTTFYCTSKGCYDLQSGQVVNED
jgi:prepilin-type N-terminal cleavage/methylation domain-containing protein